MLIDSHAHLYNLEEQCLKEVMTRAESAGVTTILNVGTDIKSSVKVLRQCSVYKGLFGTAGISPFDVDNAADNWRQELEQLLEPDKMIGIGETGLDGAAAYYPNIQKQSLFFQQHLDLAVKLNMPIVVHSRGAEKKVLKFCLESGVRSVLFHCFCGNLDILRLVLDAGYYISVSGIITFKSSCLDELVRFVPLDRLFIETDSPYLAPTPYRGKTNEPAFVTRVAEKVAHLKAVELQRLSEHLKSNFERLFGVKPLTIHHRSNITIDN